MSGKQATLIDVESLPPEDSVKQDLTEWFTDYGCSVWWEKANAPGHHTFRSEGAADKPDLIVEGGALTAAIEVKPGSDSGGVYDSVPQILRYWSAYTRGDDTYHIDGRRVEPDVFLLATMNSPQGCLYGEGFERFHTFEDMSDGARLAARKGWIPFAEYGRTKTTVRILWRFAKAEADAEGWTDTPGIGALLSTTLDGEKHQPSPKALHYVDGYQHWEVLR